MRLDDITNEKIQSQVILLTHRYRCGRIEEHNYQNSVQDLLRQQYEWAFEREMETYPHGVLFPGLISDRKGPIMSWVRERCSSQGYLVFSHNAQGKYVKYWNWIFFTDKSTALLFKLTW